MLCGEAELATTVAVEIPSSTSCAQTPYDTLPGTTLQIPYTSMPWRKKNLTLRCEPIRLKALIWVRSLTNKPTRGQRALKAFHPRGIGLFLTLTAFF